MKKFPQYQSLKFTDQRGHADALELKGWVVEEVFAVADGREFFFLGLKTRDDGALAVELDAKLRTALEQKTETERKLVEAEFVAEGRASALAELKGSKDAVEIALAAVKAKLAETEAKLEATKAERPKA